MLVKQLTGGDGLKVRRMCYHHYLLTELLNRMTFEKRLQLPAHEDSEW